uniref:Uncharacterized protein n=1 Tax=Romanomermis culicivorax TaxID=13658 RepID=A0A915I8B2_ROMCU
MSVDQFIMFLILLRIRQGDCLSSSNNTTLDQEQPSTNKHDLMRKLMSALFQENRYDKTIRPVKNIQKPVDVWLRLNLRKISEVCQ